MTTLAIHHPVGPHAGESLAQIIARKKLDIAAYGFTLWSFSSARKERIDTWRTQLKSNNQSNCVVLCSGETSKDPLTNNNNINWLTEYSYDQQNWQKLPNTKMVSYHRKANKNGIVASAFIVEDIIVPDNVKFERINSWYSNKDQKWVNSPLPTRGEYLIEMPELYMLKKGKSVKLLLKLKYPFMVWVR
jgi:hypothetical protein